MPARYRIRITRRAASQIREASHWWRENRPSARDALREELVQSFELLSLHPRIGAIARNPKLQGVRRIHLSRVRYYLYYRVREPDAMVDVLSFWHVSRGAEPDA